MRIVLVALGSACALSWSGASSATPDFPQVVVQDLSLPGITIDPPQGCTLCHPTDAGGTSLSPFGTLVRQDGAAPYDENSLRMALAQIELDEPKLIDDIKAGRDPNTDSSAAGVVHAPEYGCGLARSRSTSPFSIAAVAASGLLVAVRRGRHRRRSRNVRRAAPTFGN
jgi:hypothetical protein